MKDKEKKPETEYSCMHCGKKFSRRASGNNYKYCSRKCSGYAKIGNGSTLINCNYCGIEFRMENNILAHGKTHYCSRGCQHEKGTAHLVCLYCGKEFDRRKANVRAKTYCSKSCFLEGTKAKPKKNLRDREKIRKWHAEVLAVGKNKCHICNSLEKLHVHHIIPYMCDVSLRYEPSNGIVLCSKCHKKVHVKMNESVQRDIFYVKTYIRW